MKCANCGKKFKGVVILKQKKTNQEIKEFMKNKDTTKMLGLVLTTVPEDGIRFQDTSVMLNLFIDACEHCGVLQVYKKGD